MTKCVVCKEEYEGGSMGLEPCPNGHTLNEQIVIADSMNMSGKRRMKYPEDIELVKSDIRGKLPEDMVKDYEKALIELWEKDVIIALWDDHYGREVGISGRVLWTWNNDWEIIDSSD